MKKGDVYEIIEKFAKVNEFLGNKLQNVSLNLRARIMLALITILEFYLNLLPEDWKNIKNKINQR